jgi:hypothetical protein
VPAKCSHPFSLSSPPSSPAQHPPLSDPFAPQIPSRVPPVPLPSPILRLAQQHAWLQGCAGGGRAAVQVRHSTPRCKPLSCDNLCQRLVGRVASVRAAGKGLVFLDLQQVNLFVLFPQPLRLPPHPAAGRPYLAASRLSHPLPAAAAAPPPIV